MSIKIITDSASDMTQVEAEKLGVSVLPLTTRFGEEEYLDGVTIDFETFFKKLAESDIFPTTSLVGPARWAEEFAKYPDDEIICINVSSKLSGCYQSAVIASGDFSNVFVIDSENATIGQSLLVLLAVDLAHKGLSGKEIADILNEKKKQIRLVAVLDTLEYLKKGGRISAATAAVGTLLSIKPLVEVKDGEVKMISKARGTNGARKTLYDEKNKRGEIDYELPHSLGFTGTDRSLINKFIEEYKDDINDLENFDIRYIGAVVGTHVGPGAYGIVYFEKQ